MSIIEGVLYFAKDMFAILSIIYLFKNVFSETLRPGRTRLALCLIAPAVYSLLAQIFIKPNFDATYELLDAVSNFFYIAASYIVFKKPALFRTLAVIFIYIFTVDMLWSFVASFFDNSIIAECIFNSVLFCGVFAVIKGLSEKEDINIIAGAFREIPKWIIGALLLFELTCYYKEFGISADWYDLLYAVSASMIFVCILYLVFRIFRLIYTQNSILQRLNEQLLYSENMARSDEALRSFRHDFKNHVIVLNSLLEQGDIEGARDYFDELKKDTAPSVNTYSTGNSVVNSLLNIKKNTADEYNIKIDFSGILPDKGIESKDMCILVGNLIDNAIEASMKLPKEELKTVFVTGNVKNNMMLLTVINPVFQSEIKKENGIFRTTKKDTASHGIGLKNVKNTVKKYGGQLILKNDSDTFTAELLLPLVEN